jgi:GTP-binding protein HflX
MLFATLDPTLRRVKLPHGTIIILSDTVGFISDLPTHLVAAFRATLEEVVEADLVIHLRDISDPDSAAQAEDVERILADLGVEVSTDGKVIEVWNKVDRLDADTRERLVQSGGGDEIPSPVVISAITGEGVDQLMRQVEGRLSGDIAQMTVHLSPERMNMIDWLYRNSDVVAREDLEDGGMDLTLRVTRSMRHEIEERLAR